MKLYRWDEAESLREWQAGNIIVMAESVESARRIVREYAAKHGEPGLVADTVHTNPDVLEGGDAVITIWGSA